MRRFAPPFAAGVLLIASAASAQQAPLLRYGFDEPGGQALDTGTPPPLPGDLMGGAVRSGNTPSGSGSSVDFNGDAPYAHVLGGESDKLDGLSQLTLTTWLNLSAYAPPTTGTGNQRLVAKQAGTTFGGFNWSLNATPNDGPVGPDNVRLGIFLGNNINSAAGNFTSAFSTADIDAASKWVFLAVTYDSTRASENAAFYIGGVDTPVQSLGNLVSLSQLMVDGGVARFGVGFTDAAAATDTSLKGFQDDVRVYGSALDLAALETVRLSNVPEPASPGLVLMGGATLLARRRRA